MDTAFLEESVKTILRRLVPVFDRSTPLNVRTEKTGSGFLFDSNLNYDRLNKFYHSRVSPSHSTLTPAYLLSIVCGVEEHLSLASTRSSELAVDSLQSELITLRLSNLSKRSAKGDSERRAFMELLFNDGRALRESYNRGLIQLSQIVPVILKADRFKDWLLKQERDSDLVHQYYREISQGSFIDHLPAKSVRWLIFAGLGIASNGILPSGLGAVAGLGLSLLDSFLVDSLLKGWKPNHFIDDRLQPLLNKA